MSIPGRGNHTFKSPESGVLTVTFKKRWCKTVRADCESKDQTRSPRRHTRDFIEGAQRAPKGFVLRHCPETHTCD